MFLHEGYGSATEINDGDDAGDGNANDDLGGKRGNSSAGGSSGGGSASGGAGGGSSSGSGSGSGTGVLRGIRGMLIVPCACPTRDRDVTGRLSPPALQTLTQAFLPN